jgi:hypothetical protein
MAQPGGESWLGGDDFVTLPAQSGANGAVAGGIAFTTDSIASHRTGVSRPVSERLLPDEVGYRRSSRAKRWSTGWTDMNSAQKRPQLAPDLTKLPDSEDCCVRASPA